MREHNIVYTTTTNNDHNKLGIINRFMRTIGDMKSNEPKTDILSLVESNNDMPHRSLNYKSPNEISDEDELEYIKKMKRKFNPFHFQPGDSVKVVIDKSPLTKYRSNLSKKSYIVDSKDGNQFLIRLSDGSLDTVQGYKLVKSIFVIIKSNISTDNSFISVDDFVLNQMFNRIKLVLQQRNIVIYSF